MGDATDFDIDNYNIEELVNIIGLGSEIPLTNEKIVSTISKFTEKFEKKKKELGEEEKTKFIDFFYEIQDKLLNNKKEETVRDLFDDEIVTESITRKAIPVNSREPRKAVLYDKDIMGETRIMGMQNVNPAPFDNITADYKNPLLRNTQRNTITIDSSFRTISKYAATGKGDIGGCPDPDTQYKTAIAQTSTNFTVNLDPPIKNVLEITFESANIPNVWHVFSKDYGTDYFVEKKAVGPDSSGNYTYTDISNVHIENGNYNVIPNDKANLIDELNSKTNRLIFTYSEISNKITVTNKMSYSMGIDWYSLNVPMCSTTGNGGKIDYNLGWLLGFRNTDYILDPSGTQNASITGEATLDTTGPTYLYIALDDFNNNKPNQNLVSFQNNVSSFAMPSYYVRTTMGKNCNLTNPEYINPSNSCGKKYANKDLSSNLTSKQRYTIDQIKLAMSGQRTERYSSPNSADILTKINVQLGKSHTQVKEVNLEYKKRFYFGPVNLKKLHVRLLNDKGMDINLNNTDWNFSFIATTVYQP